MKILIGIGRVVIFLLAVWMGISGVMYLICSALGLDLFSYPPLMPRTWSILVLIGMVFSIVKLAELLMMTEDKPDRREPPRKLS